MPVDIEGIDPWIRDLAQQARFGHKDRRGTANLIDAAARARAATTITTGHGVSLARPVTETPSWFRAGPANTVETRTTDRPGFFSVGADQAVLEPHGSLNTHLDALNHIGVGNHWYAGWQLDEQATVDSLGAWATEGLVTRAIYVNIPRQRGTSWVHEDEPVEGSEIDAAMAAAELEFQPGDALLLDCGRDLYEAASHQDLFANGVSPEPEYTMKRAGVGWDAGRWIAEHDVSVLCWDMLDAEHPEREHGSKMVHLLIWAIGLVLIDNCDFAALRAERDGVSGVAGALVVAPLSIPAATGCVVNPLVIT